jgi:hypothetical protein
MKFKFIGNGDNDPDEITLYGRTFSGKKAVEITDPDAIAKLQANSHFSEVKARKTDAENDA